MTLNKSLIVQGINGVQENQPRNIQQAATAWSSFLVNYALTGLAATTIPVFAGYPNLLKQAFVGSMNAGNFLETLGTNLQTMWQTAVWSSATETGVTLAVIGSTLNADIKNNVIPVILSNLVANAVDKWTKTITVNVTNTQSGVTTAATIL